MTILEAIQRNADFFAKRGIPSPRLEAELLLAHVLKTPRLELYLNFERRLETKQIEVLEELAGRRGRREPLQYITGTASFCGIELSVSPGVLIPRPETELLAEEAWKFLNERSLPAPSNLSLNPNPNLTSNPPPHRHSIPTALDLGTGSGCLAVAMAINAPRAQVCATDASPAALDVARRNAARHELQERIQFYEGDLFVAVPGALQFDLIVSNPPYIPTSRINFLDLEVRDYEPRSALDGGADGLNFYRRIAAQAGGFLLPHGRILLELDEETSEAVKELFAGENWIVEPIRKDYLGRPRILIADLRPRCQ
jgi:release factor glutamine methyltransferase